MSELTKEYFDSYIEQLTLRLDQDKEHLNARLSQLATEEGLRATERRLMKHAEDLQAELARMVAEGFTDIQQRLDVRQRVEHLERYEIVIKQLATKAGLKLDW